MHARVCSFVLIFACAGAAAADDALPAAAAAPAAFERLKSLAGEWIDSSGSSTGKGTVAAIYRVTSGGSVVMETLFPGSSHEMISMYTREGDQIVMSHYCAMGNQPRMRATPDGGAELRFTFDGGGNIDPAKDTHMHEGVVRFGTDGTHHAIWQTFAEGKAGEHRAVFDLARKPG